LVLLVSPFCTFAQTDSPESKFLRSVLNDGKKLVLEPFHWDKKDIANLTLATGATAFVMLYDEQLHRFVVRNENKGTGKIW
jgi:hypothetical protein